MGDVPDVAPSQQPGCWLVTRGGQALVALLCVSLGPPQLQQRLTPLGQGGVCTFQSASFGLERLPLWYKSLPLPRRPSSCTEPYIALTHVSIIPPKFYAPRVNIPAEHFVAVLLSWASASLRRDRKLPERRSLFQVLHGI